MQHRGPRRRLPAPAPLDLPADNAAREPLEGMLVAPADTLTVSEVFDAHPFRRADAVRGRLARAADRAGRPGPAAQADIAAENERRSIMLDDGSNASRSATNRPYL